MISTGRLAIELVGDIVRKGIDDLRIVRVSLPETKRALQHSESGNIEIQLPLDLQDVSRKIDCDVIRPRYINNPRRRAEISAGCVHVHEQCSVKSEAIDVLQ